jgi:cytoskeletal protein RodZ
MAPHDTNTEKEAKRHATPLITMGVLVALVIVGFLWWVGRTTQPPETTRDVPAEPAATSAPVEPEAPAAPVPESGSPAAPAPETTAPAAPVTP